MSEPKTLKETPLAALHRRLDARMVPFAGYAMPVQYPTGIMKEHLATRESAGLFDVSHMGQIFIRAKSGRLEDAALALETTTPVSVAGLKPGRQRYGLFTNERGGILDDFMVANREDHLFLVANAACKQADLENLEARLGETCDVTMVEDRVLLALQGPKAEAVLTSLAPEAAEMRFMDVRTLTLSGVECIVSRSGYTGEDGYEISIPADHAEAIAEALLEKGDVAPAGLGARDSLRLEAGLCLYGNDMDEDTTPVAAALGWAIQKVRRRGGEREGGFPGAEIILAELENGAARTRVGLKPEGRRPIRAETPIYVSDEEKGNPIGSVTSGSFGPSVGGPVAMGHVPADVAVPGKRLYTEIRGDFLPLTVVELPFVAPCYKR
ncbi:glycine cleavage system aminomethyltransferase GcvT [Pararhizobium mangrovi]|uniref:aminomethyltransferase n=1 Tax=Pararhizobium mangrovi TaxID=2590452 RepID=A0A506TZ55_9HYPH|nr:glycine cleavage system aminomethyltransferase GcvT [Pararhizobium mangrovi]TPW26271.1 glycine cleavage system aminomethyltransferase GcvT [Pararhizobium mangrovi]